MARGGARKGAGRPKGLGKYNEPTQVVRLPLSAINYFNKFYPHLKLPLYSSKVAAGPPSPVEDFIAEELDLNTHLIKNPATTFFVRVNGHSMMDAGIFDNDILIVDKSIPPTPGKIVVVALDGLLTVKRLQKNNVGKWFLEAENPNYPSIEIKKDLTTCIWGVVTNVIHAV